MKTLLYNPIFINPQAYYVFPRLTRYLQPDNESTSEPANYIGTIEVKVIAYGDTTLKRTYTNTDSIDLSEFKNTWINVSLFTKVGSCVLGEWKIGNMESDLPYIDPEVLASLKAVVIVGNKTNNDSDRAIVKNLVDASNPFVISNAAFKLNSGFGKYETELSNTRIWTQSKETTSSPFSSNYNGLSGWIVFANTELTNSADMPSFKIQVKGLLEGQELIYRYYDSTGQTNVYSMTKDGKYTLPADVRTAKPLTSNTSGFQIVKNETNTITITQIPSFEGAFVTDGINDLITSAKTVQEMGITDEITVVSMIHKISSDNNWTNLIGELKGDHTFVANRGINTDKTGIYGYTYNYNENAIVINNILGDKNDYIVRTSTSLGLDNKYYVTGFTSAGIIQNISQVAWYWTFIANKVLTTDQINQVIAYYNLDRCVEPTVLYDVKRQGLSNDTPDSDWYLKDFSKNGFDMSLFNFAKKGNSGVGKYETDFLDSSIWNYKTNSSVTSDKIVCNKAATHIMLLYYSITDGNKYDVPSFNVLKQGDASEYYYIDEQGIRRTFKLLDGINTLPASHGTLFTGTEATCGFGNPGIGNSVTITQIPSHAGALCFDGINDFGKVTGMPIYKDYTVVADYQRFYLEPITGGRASILSKSSKVGDGSFIFNLEDQNGGKACYTFGEANGNISDDITRIIRYQSKYYNTKALSIGTAEDNDFMVLGKVREVDNRYFYGAIYSLMSFPYSMSEFLIERQLKKHKLGTLYPDMVEFRPIVKSNPNITHIKYYAVNGSKWTTINVGDYIPIGQLISVTVNVTPLSKIASVEATNLENVTVHKSTGQDAFDILGNVTSKSPQKINITIDEYIRFEDIIQPYPVLLRFKDENGNEVSWGGKFRVGSTITRIGSIADPESNLLNGLYSVSGLSLNGKAVTSSTSIVEKQMVFKTTATWLLDNNTPKCILSPSRLRIPNSSYKILGYIPDISGHGNNGVIHNSAYTEGSGVNEDGSYQFDGVDDFVTIPTVTGGKQVLMKVNWQSDVGAVTLYDQRLNISDYEFAIYNGTRDLDDNPVMAYQGRNNGQTYIDGILNSNIMASELKAITHNITITNELSLGINNTYPVIGSTRSNTHFAQMSLYDFMLFDEISTDEEILTLNEYVGIEGNTEWRKTE